MKLNSLTTCPILFYREKANILINSEQRNSVRSSENAFNFDSLHIMSNYSKAFNNVSFKAKVSSSDEDLFVRYHDAKEGFDRTVKEVLTGELPDDILDKTPLLKITTALDNTLKEYSDIIEKSTGKTHETLGFLIFSDIEVISRDFPENTSVIKRLLDFAQSHIEKKGDFSENATDCFITASLISHQ